MNHTSSHRPPQPRRVVGRSSLPQAWPRSTVTAHLVYVPAPPPERVGKHRARTLDPQEQHP